MPEQIPEKMQAVVCHGPNDYRLEEVAVPERKPGEALIRVDIDGDKATKAEQWGMDARVRAVDQGPDGSVYLLEDEGRLLRLEPARR